MVFDDEIPLFVDTNLGTHFALSVSRDITAGDLKAKLGMEHFSCFPNLGKIKVHRLMVKKKSFLYHLSDSIAIKHVFKGFSGAWLLHLDACQKPASLEKREVKSKRDCGKAVQNETSTVSEHPLKGEEHEGSSFPEKSGNSQTMSVTGIISRFFSELDEVDSCYFRPKHSHEAEAASKMKQQQIGSRKQVDKNSSICESHVSRRKICENRVGERVVQAAGSIRISGNGKRPAMEFLSKLKEVNTCDSSFFVRRIAFDADDFAD